MEIQPNRTTSNETVAIDELDVKSTTNLYRIAAVGFQPK